MPKYTYGGDQTVVFSHYLDVSKPGAVTTLEAEPGRTYEIKQADAPRLIQPDGQFTDQELAMPPDGDWTETEDPTWAEVEAREAAEQEQSAEAQPAPTPPVSTPASTGRPKKKEQADA
jgi:hypothetical protein